MNGAERFVYSVVKIARLYDCMIIILRNSRGAQRFVGYFFLIVLWRVFLATKMLCDTCVAFSRSVHDQGSHEYFIRHC